MKGIPVKALTPQGWRTVGTLQGFTFIKRVKKSQHFHRITQSWGVQKDVLAELERRGVKEVRVEDTETGTVYLAPLRAFREHGFTLDFGHGEQIFLRVQYWQVIAHDTAPRQQALPFRW
ncbi:MAG: hypothetical protein D9V47_13780 [Clostridia bacterium]|nr:MAG: hypothetical protein D9V47_13780 [Clostridia bacterium]